jgi:CelD/BcsL family acetyltransferase involved in cellulose biosynthesis
MFSIKKINNDSKFFQLRGEWNNLLKESDSNNIFLTHEWMAIHWMHYKRDNGLYILLILDNNDMLVGIAPLKITRNKKYGAMIRTLEFMGSDYVASEYLDFIFKSGIENQCMKVLIDHLMSEKDWDCMSLVDIYSNSVNYRLLRECISNFDCFNESHISNNCPYITLPKSWNGYLNSLNRKRRYNMRSREKSLQKKHTIEIVYADENHKTINESMQKYFELQEQRIQDKGISSIVTNKNFQQFHIDIIKSFLGNGWLSLTFLKVDGDEAACLYGYKYNNKYYHYQGGFRPELKRYGIGTLIIAKQIEKLIESGYREYDFLRGNEEYKYDWTASSRKEVDFTIYRKTKKNQLIYILDKY